MKQWLTLLLVAVPYCNIARLAPDPMFWSQWTSLFIAVIWLIASAQAVPTRHLPFGALVFVALALVMAAQAFLGIPVFPTATLIAIVVMLMAVLVASHSSTQASAGKAPVLLGPLAAGTILAMYLNAIAAVAGYFGFGLLVFEIVQTPLSDRAVGLVGQANHFGVLGVLGAGSAQYLFRRGSLGSKALLMALLIGAACCAASGSRVALIAWVLLVGSSFALRRQIVVIGDTPRQGKTIDSALFLTLLLVAAQILWWAITRQSPQVGGLETTAIRMNTFERTELLRDAFQLWVQHPLTGVGYGNFAEGRLMSLNGSIWELNATNAHNLIMQALAEWGTPGGLAVTLSLIYISFRVWVALFSAQPSRALAVQHSFVGTWLAVMLLHSLVEYPLWFLRCLIPFSLMLGLLPQRTITWTPGSFANNERLKRILAGVMALGCLLGAYDYRRTQLLTNDLISQIENSADGRGWVKLEVAAHIANFTLFPVFPEIMLARALPINAGAIDEKLRIVTRALNAIPNVESAARYIAFSIVASKDDQADALLDSLSRRNQQAYKGVRSALNGYAVISPAVAAYLRAHPSSTVE